VDCRSVLSNWTHFGSLVHCGPGVGAPEADGWHARFAERGVLGSATVLPRYGIGARVLGPSADSLFRALAVHQG
jgi:hypothetical protein